MFGAVFQPNLAGPKTPSILGPGGGSLPDKCLKPGSSHVLSPRARYYQVYLGLGHTMRCRNVSHLAPCLPVSLASDWPGGCPHAPAASQLTRTNDLMEGAGDREPLSASTRCAAKPHACFEAGRGSRIDSLANLCCSAHKSILGPGGFREAPGRPWNTHRGASGSLPGATTCKMFKFPLTWATPRLVATVPVAELRVAQYKPYQGTTAAKLQGTQDT
jgi:hypothetical protein